MNKEKLLKKIQQLRKENLDDVLEYHENLLVEEEGFDSKENDLLNFLYDLSLDGFEDVCFFIGYLRCLDDMEELTKKLK